MGASEENSGLRPSSADALQAAVLLGQLGQRAKAARNRHTDDGAAVKAAPAPQVAHAAGTTYVAHTIHVTMAPAAAAAPMPASVGELVNIELQLAALSDPAHGRSVLLQMLAVSDLRLLSAASVPTAHAWLERLREMQQTAGSIGPELT